MGDKTKTNGVNVKEEDERNADQNRNEKGEKVGCEAFEEILDLVGGEGKYQKIFLYAVICPFIFITPFLSMNAIFMLDLPDHWCKVPGKSPEMSIEDWKNWTIPWETGPDGILRSSKCKMLQQSDNNAENGTIIDCQHGWDYDKTDYESTIPSAFNWVCDKDYYASETHSWASFGGSVGSIVLGFISDRFGRKQTFFIATFIYLMFKGIGLFVAPYFLVFRITSLLTSAASSVLYTTPLILIAEICGTGFRAWIYSLTYIVWVIGNSLLPLIMMATREWFLFACVTSAPGLIIILSYPIVDKSPRWLITRGRTKEACKILMKVAKTNKTEVDANHLLEKLEILTESQKSKKSDSSVISGITAFFKYRRLLKNSVMLILAWSMNSMLYGGLTFQTTRMAGNKFLNYFLMSIIELPGAWLGGILVEKTGRRWTQAGFFMWSAFFSMLCAIAAVTNPGSILITVVGTLAIKLGVSVSFMVVFLQVTEIYPTAMRAGGQGVTYTISGVLGTFSPYIAYSGNKHASLPYVFMGLSALLGMIASSFLPETLKQKMPETIEDANDLGKDQKFWSFLPKSSMQSETKKVDCLLENRGESKANDNKAD